MIQITHCLAQIIIGFVLLAYAFILYKAIGKKRDASMLSWAVIFIVAAGLIIHFLILHTVATTEKYVQYQDWATLLLGTIQFTLEMFLGNTFIYKLLDENGIIPRGLFYIFVPIYWMAVLTSCFAIMHLISRWIHNRMWLKFHKNEASTGKSHIFIGCNSASQKLADDIHQNFPDHRIIFVDLPDEGDTFKGITILDIISRFFKDSKESENMDKYIILKAGRGLERLVHWLQNENNRVYILSDSQEINMMILEQLWKPSNNTGDDKPFKCKIYCHAKREGLITRYETIPDEDNRINFVDSSFLAVEYLKKEETSVFLPVNYVDIATDPQTEARLGYITSDFNCAILGFGETGREAMKFLYEYGAFPNKDKGKAKFACHIYDRNLNDVIGEYGQDLKSLHSSETKTQEFYPHQNEIGSPAFWSMLRDDIKDLNYIVVSLGDDKLNFQTALNIAEFALIEGRPVDKKLCIAVNMRELSPLDQKTLKNANQVFGNCIHVFGLLDDIWKMNVITNETMDADAKRFYNSYRNSSAALNLANGYPDVTWEEREEKLHSSSYKDRCEARRKIMQDYSNCLHKNTKQLLCKGAGVNADSIIPVNDGDKHCEGKDTNIFEYLAVCEHLRWEASHLVLGYRASDNVTDDMKKLHKCIKPYAKLNETVKHFDWLVVKNSL